MYCTILPSQNTTFPTVISTLSLHDALPICTIHNKVFDNGESLCTPWFYHDGIAIFECTHVQLAGCIIRWRYHRGRTIDRKSTRLNSSHVSISYAVFCLKKKKIYVTNRYQKL